MREQICDVVAALRCTVPGAYWHKTSDAVIPGARCRAGRPCLEGSKSRNRLSGIPAWPVFFFPLQSHTSSVAPWLGCPAR